jgi:hypothetical protein
MQHPWERKRERESESDKGKQREHASDEHMQSPETMELKPPFLKFLILFCAAFLGVKEKARKKACRREIESEKGAKKEQRESMNACKR